MSSSHVSFSKKPIGRYLIAGWNPQWSDGGEVSSGLPKYLIQRFRAERIGEMNPSISEMCYPFQVPGTHDAFRPGISFREGLPSNGMYRRNVYYDAGDGLILFLGEEPWFNLSTYAETFFDGCKQLGINRVVAVEGINGAVPPDMERSISTVYSRPYMKKELELYGVRFSNYGSDTMSGPTIGMAMVNQAHYVHTDVEMFRLAAIAPLYSFLPSANQSLGISPDHRSFYDIMRRLKAMFKIDIDLSELLGKAESECENLQKTLENISANNSSAKDIISQARSEFVYTPFVEHVELGPELDRTLDEIIRNSGESPQDIIES